MMRPAHPSDYIRHDAAVVSGTIADIKPAVTASTQPSDQQGGYASRDKIYPRAVKGTFRQIKWAVMFVTLGIYYLVPWLRWSRVDGQPDQAVLFDLGNQRIYLGPIELWAQEFYFISGLLILSALALFLVTSIAGRMWCGYACPQTVWTDLMLAIERFWQGDRSARIRLDKGPLTLEKVWKKTATHASWIVVALLTGGAFVFYFRDAPTLAQELALGTAPVEAYAFVLILTSTTYLLGGIMRDQVCIYMCPWPRIQGAMLDADSLLISYRASLGEPRAPARKDDDWSQRGGCIDCRACVSVCPMGIDIREGSQLECIQCALCVDACNDVMRKIGRPTGLVTYATLKNVDGATGHPRAGWRIMRPRTVLYSVVITAIVAVMTFGFVSRSDLQFSVAADRNPLYVKLRDGSLRNGYTLHVVNKSNVTRSFALETTGLGATPDVRIIGSSDKMQTFAIGPGDVRNMKAYVALSKNDAKHVDASGSTPITFVIRETDTGVATQASSTFHGPKL